MWHRNQTNATTVLGGRESRQHIKWGTDSSSAGAWKYAAQQFL